MGNSPIVKVIKYRFYYTIIFEEDLIMAQMVSNRNKNPRY